LIDGNYIDESHQVVRVERGSFDCATMWKRTYCPSPYELTLLYATWWEFDRPFMLWLCRLTLRVSMIGADLWV